MSRLFLKELSSGKSYEVKKEIMKIGRSNDAELPLSSPSISRHHATLYMQATGLVIEDAGSQNGVIVNKKKIAAATSLKLGDRIEMGGIEFEVFDPERPVAEPVQLSIPRSGPDPFIRQDYSPPKRKKAAAGNRRLLLYGGVAVVLVLFIALAPEDAPQRDPAAVQEVEGPSQEELTKALNSEAYSKGNHVPKSPTEVEAESRFRQAMRDYYDGNYSRAIVVLKQALVANPGHEEAGEYLQFAQRRLDNQIDSLMKSGQRSYSVLQYSRARSEFSQVLSILSEQIPGYWQRIASDLNKNEDRRPAQELALLQVPCEKTKRKDSCLIAVDMIKLCRKLLGEEDVLK